ncbi:MAG: sugar ABC transporter permease [Oscillospiraceae bacterium]|nr:sugar ABC transporter permease [Oscillospiraceae bacterium]
MRQSSDSAGFLKRNRHILYLLPWILGFLLFRAGPMLYSFFCSFTDFHLFRGISAYGLMNYRRIAFDPEARRACGLTLKYALICVPLKTAAALFAAVLLSGRLRGIRVFRTLYYIPAILGTSVAAAVLWKAMFRDRGAVNQLLVFLHLPAVSWLSDSHAALWVIILLRVWEFGAPMLLFLAALQQIPQDISDAAALDGAGKAGQFFRITLPLISPVLYYNIMLAFCNAFQEFSAPFVITAGGPRGATGFLSVLLYRSAFTANDMGYACALAWTLFILSAGFSAGFFFFRKRFVFAADEGGIL